MELNESEVEVELADILAQDEGDLLAEVEMPGPGEEAENAAD